MALEIAVVRATTPATSTTLDFTSSGFGTPTAAIFFMAFAGADGTVVNNAIASVGFTDGTNQGVAAGSSLDGAAESESGRNQNSSFVVLQAASLDGAVQKSGAFNSWITDGVRLDWNLVVGTAAMTVVCVLIKGVDANVGTFTPNATQNLTASITGLSYEPDVAFFIGAGGTFNTAAVHQIMSFGVALNGDTIKQRTTLFFDQDGQTTMNTDQRIETDSAMGQFFNDTINWTAEVTSFNSDGLTATTRDGATGGDTVRYLTLGPLGVSADLQTIASPTTVTTQKYSTSFQTDAIIGMFSKATAVDSSQTDSIQWFAAKNGGNKYCIGEGSVNGAGDSDVYSITDSKVVNLRTASGPWAAFLVADIDSWNSDGVTFDWTTVDGTARQGWALIIGAGGATVPIFDHHYRMLRGA